MKKILSIILILVLLICLTGCKPGEKEKFTDYSFDSFDTVTTIIGFEENEETFQKNCTKIKNWLLEYHKLYDIYTSYDGITNLHTLNRSQNKEVTVDSKIIDLLVYSKELYSKTKGKFNIAMGNVLSIWHDYRSTGSKHPEKAELPSKEILEAASLHTDINNIIINKEKSTVLINDSKLTIDVGGVAKGYAVQKIAERMQKEGLEGYLLNIGGNIKIVGQKNDGNAWTVGIENPDQNDQDFVEKLSLKNGSLVTSGSYQRYYYVDGISYHHIIDSTTLYPAIGFKSVSVLTEDSALADVLSTALFCLSYEEGLKVLENFKSVEAMWVNDSGEKLYTNGFKKYILK